MDYNIKLDIRCQAAAVQQLIAVLNNGPHGLVRPIIDDIVLQAQEQEKAAQAAAAAAPTDVEPKTSAEAVI